MRVLYDATLLGMGHRREVPRTGVFRAVEHTARALARSGGCELAFGAVGPLRKLNDSLDYLAGSGLRDLPVVAPPLVPRVARLLGSGKALTLFERAAGRLNHRIPYGIDVYHSPCLALPPRARRAGGVQRVLTVYDLIAVLFPEFFEPEVVDGVKGIVGSLRPDDWAITISEHTRADLCAYRPDLHPSRVFVTPLAADPQLFYRDEDEGRQADVRARYGIPRGPYLLSLNTLEPRKNMDRLVRSFSRLVHEQGIPDLSLVLVGATGWKAEAVFEAVRGAGAHRARIVLAGFVADPDLAVLYSGALAFVYPSLYEGFGLPPLEAMQCGVPVISSNTSALPEVVGGAGIMVDPLDEDALSQAMLDVYRDGALRERMGALSLSRAAQFSWARCAEQTVAGYRAAMAGR